MRATHGRHGGAAPVEVVELGAVLLGGAPGRHLLASGHVLAALAGQGVEVELGELGAAGVPFFNSAERCMDCACTQSCGSTC